MSHSARINGLTDELVRHFFATSERVLVPDDHAILQARTFAQKGVRNAQYARVNQFEVNNRLNGLVEKFAVLNNDTLSEALKERLDELSVVSDKITPELLSLFLALSDRPSEKTVLSDIGINQESEPEASITWAQILADDPYSDDELWQNVEAGSEASEEDHYGRANGHVRPQRTQRSPSSIEEEVEQDLSAYIAPSGADVLARIRTTRKAGQIFSDPSVPRVQQAGPHIIHTTEVQIIREVLHVMRGFPSKVLVPDASQRYQLQMEITTSSVSTPTVRGILNDLLRVATQLKALRSWCNETGKAALSQRYQSAILGRLKTFDHILSDLEQVLIQPKVDSVVSIQRTCTQVHESSKQLMRLHDMIRVCNENQTSVWSLLDDVYREACMAQMTDQNDVFDFFARLFIDCLPPYLDPLRFWISEGKLIDEHDSTFIVAKSRDTELPRSALWHDQYSMRTTVDGRVIAPTFIKDLTANIFSTGKAVMFLHAINPGQDEVDEFNSLSVDLSFESVCGPLQDSPLWSFEELLHTALRTWIDANARSKPVVLRNAILHQHGLLSLMRLLRSIYLSLEGAAFDDFAITLFTRLRDQRSHWHDPFVLTSLAQTSFAHYLTSPDRLSVRVSRKGCKASPDMTRQIPRVRLQYAIPWQLQNVTREAEPSAFQQVFILLLQISRVRYLLTPLTVSSDTRLRSAEAGVAQALGLKQRLLWYSLTLQGHISQVTQQTLNGAVSKMESCAGIDEMSATYAEMNKALLRRSLLTHELLMIHQALIAALEIAEGFSKVWQHFRIGGGTEGVSGCEDNGIDLRYYTKGTEKTTDVTEAIEGLRQAFVRQLEFAVTGLRSIARVGGEESWGMLVEKLEMGSNVGVS
ncbi:hypothetical protein MBLNU457_g1050t1 [Dothideomycetes sp. NU457]